MGHFSSSPEHVNRSDKNQNSEKIVIKLSHPLVESIGTTFDEISKSSLVENDEMTISFRKWFCVKNRQQNRDSPYHPPPPPARSRKQHKTMSIANIKAFQTLHVKIYLGHIINFPFYSVEMVSF